MSVDRTGYSVTPNTDQFTGFDIGITGDHAYIHQGRAFTGIIETGSISSAYNISFTTPATKYVHYRPIGITTSAAYIGFKLYEGDAYTSGSAVTPINRNRTSTAVSGVSMVKGSTVTPAGTVVDVGGIGTAGTPAASGGGGGGQNEELVLKQNTKYTLALTPSSATLATLKLFWYEEDAG